MDLGARSRLDDCHALVVGVSAYHGVAALPAGVGDGARELAAVLADPDLGGYPPDQVRLLVDGEATREAIREELSVLAALTGPGSTLIVYFAGHGGKLGGAAGGDACLIPVEADDSSAGALAATAVSGAELATALAAIPAGRALVVLDCCHSGGFAGAGAPRALLEGGLPDSWCEALGAGRGRVVLAAARSDELSWLPEGAGPSHFTRHLLAALRGAAGTDGWVRVWDLFEYVQPRVTGERPDQHPVFKAELEENFPVTLALGGRGGRCDGGDGFRYDAYLSYADREPDASRVWEVLVPRLEAAGLAVAVSHDVEEPGAFRVVAAERGIEQARRTVVLLSDAYFEDEMTGFVDALAQTIGLEEGASRLVPVTFGTPPANRLPARLRMLVGLDLGHPQRAARNVNRLIQALHSPLSRPRLAAG